MVSCIHKENVVYFCGRPINIKIDEVAKHVTLDFLELPKSPTCEQWEIIMSERPAFTRQLGAIMDLKEKTINPFY